MQRSTAQLPNGAHASVDRVQCCACMQRQTAVVEKLTRMITAIKLQGQKQAEQGTAERP